MFTGRIHEIGEVETVGANGLGIRAAKSAGRVAPGGSVNVAGVCVTAERVEDDLISVSISDETRRRTTFDEMTAPGRRVNVETPLAVGDPLDGHLVQGHVDGVGKVVRVDDGPGVGRRLWIRPPERFMARIAAKGSVAVDGVSLTVAEIVKDRFSVALIPSTLAGTTLAELAVGERVNIESDVVGRLAAAGAAAAGANVARAVAALGWAGHLSGRAGVEKVVQQLAAGGAVMVWDPEREIEGDVIFAGANLRPAAFTFLLTEVFGYPCVPCAPDVLERLEIGALAGAGDRQGTAFHTPVDLASNTGTGVSAAERAATVRQLADPGARPADFASPGHVIPIAARPGLLRERAGHTESTVALCVAAGLAPVGVCCEVMKRDGTMAGAADLEASALRWGLPLVDIDDLRTWL
ncbi:riboflavin synthase [Nonomuraea sp. PA05]|uniref:riboflavin synthase n=1 Tax=Nonomuraea sp. PA05 TaxID=2604466 RepID=UPI0011D74FB6|nr:riboflavin synthase [Nonomuraea sp. PA05]TYB47536.1 riboflavin synthase [Nonomuraea sp. PA05]